MKADTRADCQDSWMIQILESVIPLALDGLTFYHTVIRLMTVINQQTSISLSLL